MEAIMRYLATRSMERQYHESPRIFTNPHEFSALFAKIRAIRGDSCFLCYLSREFLARLRAQPHPIPRLGNIRQVVEHQKRQDRLEGLRGFTFLKELSRRD